MNTMIERVARAICIVEGAFNPDESTDGIKDWKIYEPHARIAIAAMRKVDFTVFGTDYALLRKWKDRTVGLAHAGELTWAQWEEMWARLIDAILEEK